MTYINASAKSSFFGRGSTEWEFASADQVEIEYDREGYYLSAGGLKVFFDEIRGKKEPMEDDLSTRVFSLYQNGTRVGQVREDDIPSGTILTELENEIGEESPNA